MATGLSIRSVSPVATGDAVSDVTAADVLVDGLAVGALVLLCASTPDLTKAVPIVPLSSAAGNEGGTVYRLNVAYPGLWYFWARDGGGTSDAGAGWPGLSADRDLNLIGQWLADTLEANKAGLEAALRAKYFPGVTIKEIVYGSAASIRDFPAILVSKPREQADWVALPLIREHVYSLEIALFVVHQDPASLLPVGVQFTAAAMSVLNKLEYETITLDSGTNLAFCAASQGECNESQIDEALWCAVGSVLWSGKALKQGGIA